MGTSGILYVHTSSADGGVKTETFYVHCDSMEVLVEARKKFLRTKTAKGLGKLIDSIKTDRSFELTEQFPKHLDAANCWQALLQYSLVVTINGLDEEKSSFQVLVDLVQQTISQTEFKPVKGQRKQDRRTPEQKAADKAEKIKHAELRRKMIEWSDDGIHGHELCLQREWKAEISRITDPERIAKLEALIEESKGRLPQATKSVEPEPESKPKEATAFTDAEAPPLRKRSRGRPKKILTDEEKLQRKAAAVLKQRERRAAKKIAEAALRMDSGPGPNSLRSQLAPWIASQN